MSLLKCPECQGKVSESAPACPHCGLPIQKVKESHAQGVDSKQSAMNESDSSKHSILNAETPPQETRNEKVHPTVDETVSKSEMMFRIRKSLGVLGGIFLVIGVFVPFLKAPGEDYASLFGNGNAIAALLIGWGLISLGFIAANRLKEIIVPGFLSGAIVALLYWAISSQSNSQSLVYGIAWWILTGGVVLILISGSLPGSHPKKKSAVLLWVLVVILSLISLAVFAATSDTIGRSFEGSSSTSTQSFLGIGEEGLTGTCKIGRIEVRNMPERKPNGSAWDPFNGAPDPMLIIYIDGIEEYSSNPFSDRYGSLSWNPNLAVDFEDVSSITIEILDEDTAIDDRMLITDLNPEEMRWGENSYSNNSGLTLEVEIE